jgi:hypothetical protein
MARKTHLGGPKRAGLVLGLAVALAAVGLSLPAADPADSPANLPVRDPVAFLARCLEHLDELKLTGYSTRLDKQERLEGKLQPSEDIEVLVRLEPYSVFMRWLRGARRADRALYVEGENDGKILVHPTGLAGEIAGVVSLALDSPAVRKDSRFGIKELGLRKTLARTLEDWRAGQARGKGRLEYLGLRTVREAGDRVCYTLRRTTAPPDPTGVVETTVYVDKENWLQVGTVLKGPNDELLGAYFYRDILFNPNFAADQFQPAALTQ